MNSVFVALIVSAVVAQALIMAGVWILAGIGWASIAASILPIAATIVLGRSLARGAAE
ncbi:hypothetical protein [Hydrocarboniphaga effusa]|uniref:hypothetical protein n=1 Tax=Hydrocarboniphaga effusa TaxID=243629 RepID=UPI00398C0CE6